MVKTVCLVLCAEYLAQCAIFRAADVPREI